MGSHKSDAAQTASPDGAHDTERPGAAGRGRRVVWGLVALGLGAALGLVLIECVFRLFVPVTDVPANGWDPACGRRPLPNQSGRYLKGSRIDGRYAMNSGGWNNPRDYTVPRPAGTKRICIVGDSYVEAVHVQPGQPMFAVAERLMNKPDRPVQWYSFGVSGFGTAQEYEVIRHYVLDYHPDIVVMLFVENDVWDCSPYIAPIARWYPTYCLDKAGELELIPTRGVLPRSRLRGLIKRSALARYLYMQKGLRFKRPRGRVEVGQAFLRDDSLQGELSAISRGLSLDERQEKSWELIGKLLEACRDECGRRGALFALAYRGDIDLIDSAASKTEYAPAPRDKDPYCLTERIQQTGQDRLAPLAKQLGIPYLDLTGPLCHLVEQTGRSYRFPDDYHYNAAGHETVGEALAQWCERLLSD